jgi:hypothetical protein
MKHLVGLAALASLVAVVGAAASTTAQPAASADSVYAWNLTAVNTLNALPPPAGGAAPAAQVEMGMVEGAVYDAVNAITPKHFRPYLLKRRFSAASSTDAAVATAAHDVLANIVSTVPSISDAARQTALQLLAASYASSLADIDDGPFKTQGVAAGHAAAGAMIAARQNDGRFGPSQWVPNPSAGHWSPLLDANNNPILDPTPWVGGVRPFLLESSSQFRSVDPLPIDSPAYAADFNEVKAKGSATALARRPNAHSDVHRTLVAEQPHDQLERRRDTACRRAAASMRSTPLACLPWRTSVEQTRRSAPGTTSTTSTSGGPWNAIRRAAEDNNRRPTPTRPGPRSSQRPIRSIRPGTSPGRRAPARSAHVLPERARGRVLDH